jgi:DNA helicase-2/ATP-dependent DNA helicase PcrA
MWIGTFHGLANRLLRLHWQDAKLPEGFQVMDSDDQLRLVKRVVQALELDDGKYPPKQIAWWINAQKDEGRRPQHIQPEPHDAWLETMRQAYIEYQARCDRAGLVDFAELLLRAHELLRDNPALLAHYRARFREILVDEFQDTNAIQYAFVRVLAGDSGHVFVVGDDDQAIYGWRGAKVENVQGFLRDFPGAQTIRLEQNYRSTANILGAANAVIAHNPDRIGKQLWTDSGDGEPIDLYAAYNEMDEARYIVERARQWVRDGGSYTEVAVLYRSNAQSRALEEALLSEQVPYRVYGGMRFFERAEIKDALAYLRLLSNRNDDAAFERAVNTPTRGIGDRTLDEVRREARAQGISLWEATMLVTQGNALAARAQCAGRLPGAGQRAAGADRAHDPGRARGPRAGPLAAARALEQGKPQCAGFGIAHRQPRRTGLGGLALRAPRRRHRGSGRGHGRAGRVPGLCRAGGRRGPGAGRRGRRAADDPALGQGPGVPAGVPGRHGRRPVPAHVRWRKAGGWKKSAAWPTSASPARARSWC